MTVKIQSSLLLLTTPEYWVNHRACPHCGYSALEMEGYRMRLCPLCGLEFNITTGLKPANKKKEARR